MLEPRQLLEHPRKQRFDEVVSETQHSQALQEFMSQSKTNFTLKPNQVDKKLHFLGGKSVTVAENSNCSTLTLL